MLHTQSFPLKVTASEEPFRLPAGLAQREAFQKEIQLEAKDIHYIHEEIPSETQEKVFRGILTGLAGANLLGFVLTGAGLLRNRREALFARDHGLRRRTLAHSLAKRRLKLLKKLAASEKDEEAERFIEEAEKVLSEYFSSKFNVSSYSFTREWLELKLAEILSTEELLLKEIREFYDVVREARFGKGILPSRKRQELFQLIEKSIHRIEKKL